MALAGHEKISENKSREPIPLSAREAGEGEEKRQYKTGRRGI
jgi:hypothetical protein